FRLGAGADSMLDRYTALALLVAAAVTILVYVISQRMRTTRHISPPRHEDQSTADPVNFRGVAVKPCECGRFVRSCGVDVPRTFAEYQSSSIGRGIRQRSAMDTLSSRAA